MSLTEFLLARIAEDETIAQSVGEAHLKLQSLKTVEPLNPTAPRWSLLVRDHVNRWDPARVLAECEAKRRIVAMHKPGVELCYWSHDSSAVHDDDPCLTLRLLALPYADHPSYLPEWRPDPVKAE